MQFPSSGYKPSRSDLNSSVQAFDNWLEPTREIKAQSAALKDAVKSLGRDACPALKASVKQVYELSSNLKACLKAIIPTYNNDLKRITQGKSPRSLVDHEQEYGTFKTHVRVAESLVAAVLDPTNAPECQGNPVPGFNNPQPLQQAYGGANFRGASSEQLATLNHAYFKTVGAASRLRGSLNAWDVRTRVLPLSTEPDYFVNEARERVVQDSPYNTDYW